MQLLTGPDAHDLVPRTGCNHASKVHDLHGWDLLDVDLPTFHVIEGMPYQFDTFLQGDHEARHAPIRDGQDAFLPQRLEVRND